MKGIHFFSGYFRSISAKEKKESEEKSFGGWRIGSPTPRLSHVVLSDPPHAGTSNAPSSNHADVRRGIVPTGAAGKARAKVIRWQLDPMDMLARSALARDHEYNDIPDDDFSTATLGEEIDLTLFPLALGPYCMSYPFVDGEGRSS
ncbi:hypothetical protein Tco_0027148 [Tanacetum coccineum]